MGTILKYIFFVMVGFCWRVWVQERKRIEDLAEVFYPRAIQRWLGLLETILVRDFLFEINFALEDKFKEEQLKCIINDYHLLFLGTTKQIKSKIPKDAPEANDVTFELNALLDQFEIGFPAYKEFNKIKHKEK